MPADFELHNGNDIMRSMKKMTMIYLIAVILINLACMIAIFAIKGHSEKKIPIRALILPKFEIGDISGDFPGEAQFYYNGLLNGGKEYVIPTGDGNLKIYVKDEIALCVIGMSKTNAALNTMRVLSDERFDFSKTYVISTGCAGSAIGNSVMGDVFIITGCADYDIGHHADPREMTSGRLETWFHDPAYDSVASIKLDKSLTDRIYELVKDVKLETTEQTRKFMKTAFPGKAWADRNPKVLKGSTLTSDNYWKGKYSHDNAILIAKTYALADPFATTEMEDNAIGLALRKLGMSDRYIIIRDSVNMDVFMMGETPESLWDPDAGNSVAAESSKESANIFTISMENNYKVGKVIIDAIKNGRL